MTKSSVAYEDSTVRVDADGVTIKGYYFPFANSKFVPFADIRSVGSGVLPGWGGRLRLWGTSDFISWYSLDLRRPAKDIAVVLDVNSRISPSFTPTDAAAVTSAIEERISAQPNLRSATTGTFYPVWVNRTGLSGGFTSQENEAALWHDLQGNCPARPPVPSVRWQSTFPVDWLELLAELDVIAAKFARDDADEFDRNAISALQHVVSEHEQPSSQFESGA